MGVITNDQILASFKEIWWTPQYFDNMLYVLAKLKQYGVYTFFLTFSRDEFEWPYIIQANHSIFMHLCWKCIKIYDDDDDDDDDDDEIVTEFIDKYILLVLIT